MRRKHCCTIFPKNALFRVDCKALRNSATFNTFAVCQPTEVSVKKLFQITIIEKLYKTYLVLLLFSRNFHLIVFSTLFN